MKIYSKEDYREFIIELESENNLDLNFLRLMQTEIKENYSVMPMEENLLVAMMRFKKRKKKVLQ